MDTIYRKNEYETNETVAKSILVIFGFILLMGIFCYIGIFDIDSEMLMGFIVASVVPLLLPSILIHGFHVAKPWMKYLLVFLVALETGICYVFFTFQTVLIFLIPSVLAAFYLEKKIMYYSGVMTCMMIAVSHLITAFHLFQPWIEPFQELSQIMLYGALPRILQYALCFFLLRLLIGRCQAYMEGFDSIIQEERSKRQKSISKKDTENEVSQMEEILQNLTEREKEVFSLLVRGYTNMQIADNLCLSMGTVKNYVSVIYDKLECRDRTGLILKYSRFYE